MCTNGIIFTSISSLQPSIRNWYDTTKCKLFSKILINVSRFERYLAVVNLNIIIDLFHFNDTQIAIPINNFKGFLHQSFYFFLSSKSIISVTSNTAADSKRINDLSAV